LFNSLIAPIAFTFISEYPVTLVAACLLLPRLAAEDNELSRTLLVTDLLPASAARFMKQHLPWLRLSFFDLVLPAGIFVLCSVLDLRETQLRGAVRSVTERILEDAEPERIRNTVRTVVTIIMYGLPAMLCYFFVERPIRFGLSVAALYLAAHVAYMRSSNEVLYLDRSFFGTLKVEESKDPDGITREEYLLSVPEDKYVEGTRNYERQVSDAGREHFYRVRWYHRLVHGTTLHGKQLENAEMWGIMAALSPLGSGHAPGAATALAAGAWESWQYPGRDPLTYYARSGPVGAMFDAWRAREHQSNDVACIGLGTGTLSSYGLPGQKMTFFEIDTHVRRLVEAPKYFTYIDSARRQAVDIEFKMGDARLELERLEDRRFGMMLVDAFSSDAIPVHLLTLEAVKLYFDRLTDDGILGLHISNRYLALEPVVDRIVKELKLEARVFHDYEDGVTHKTSSTWIAVARTRQALGEIDTGRWLQMPASTGAVVSAAAALTHRQPWGFLNPEHEDVGLWTDDYSPIMRVLTGDMKLFK
jgi:hypothetical protein